MGLFRTEPLCLLIRAARIKAHLTARTKWGRGLGVMSFMTFGSASVLVPGQHLLPKYSGAHVPLLRILRSHSLPQHLTGLSCNKQSELGLCNTACVQKLQLVPERSILSCGSENCLGSPYSSVNQLFKINL